MKRIIGLISIIVLLAFLSSCAGHLKNPEDASEAVGILVAGLMPVIMDSFRVDPAGAEIAIWTSIGYTQPGGGEVLFELVPEPVLDSEFDPIPGSYFFQVTFTDFIVPYGESDYTLNGTFYLELATDWSGSDALFTFTIFGDEISISGEGIDDTFGLDVRAILNIDAAYDAGVISVTVSGSLKGTVNGIVLDVPDWSFTFQYENPFPF